MIFVAAENGNGPLRPVGWYRNAQFETGWQDRPEYKTDRKFELDKSGERYCYVVSAPEKDVHFIPPEFRRQFRVPGTPHFRQAPFLYALAPGYSEPWRKTYAKLAKKIVMSPPRISGARKPRGHGFPDPSVGAKVEKAAITAAKHLLAGMDYDYIRSREDECCGYDLFASSTKRRNELHVEVKGTQAPEPWFVISANEKRSAQQDPNWRLVMVVNALTSRVPKLMTWKQVKERFHLEPTGWVGHEK